MIFKSLLAAEGRVCKLCYKLGLDIDYHIVVEIDNITMLVT